MIWEIFQPIYDVLPVLGIILATFLIIIFKHGKKGCILLDIDGKCSDCHLRMKIFGKRKPSCPCRGQCHADKHSCYKCYSGGKCEIVRRDFIRIARSSK